VNRTCDSDVPAMGMILGCHTTIVLEAETKCNSVAATALGVYLATTQADAM
jgi:hypothetical protein